ncbi:hypothetical protein Bca101_086004 [Brassica carinata]
MNRVLVMGISKAKTKAKPEPSRRDTTTTTDPNRSEPKVTGSASHFTGDAAMLLEINRYHWTPLTLSLCGYILNPYKEERNNLFMS